MNSTLFLASETFLNTSAMTVVDYWLIPLDILSIVCTTSAIILVSLFLMIILLDKTCWTVPIMLVANSCLIELMLVSTTLSMSVFTLQNDLKQIQYQDLLCVCRGYLVYALTALYNYSYLLQSTYRYVTVVYPTRLFWQSARTQMVIIILSWVLGFGIFVPFLFAGEIIYNADNQICQMPLRLSFSLIFAALCIYMIPISLLMFSYFKLVRYVQEMNKRVTLANILLRAQRELKMVRRTVILVMILFAVGFPYFVVVLISFFTTPPKYHFRIAFIFIHVSMVLVIVTLFQFTDPIKACIKKIINGRPNIVVPTVT